MLGCIYAQQGKREAALAQMEKIQLIGDQHHRNHIAPWFRGAIPYLQARVYAVLGEKEKAVEHLKTAIDQGQLYIWWNVVFDLDFVNLKGYEPFEVLIQPEKPEK